MNFCQLDRSRIGGLTFYETAVAELEVVKVQAVWRSHAGSQRPADYQHIPMPRLLEQQAIKA